MNTLRHRVALRTIGHRFSFLVTKDVLQLRALIEMECLGWSENIKCPFDKSFCNGLRFLVRKCDEHSKSSEMIDYS